MIQAVTNSFNSVQVYLKWDVFDMSIKFSVNLLQILVFLGCILFKKVSVYYHFNVVDCKNNQVLMLKGYRRTHRPGKSGKNKNKNKESGGPQVVLHILILLL